MKPSYNSKLISAMSEQRRSSSAKAYEIRKQLNELLKKLEDDKKVIPYERYIAMEKEAAELKAEYYTQCAKTDVWDEARELCMRFEERKL